MVERGIYPYSPGKHGLPLASEVFHSPNNRIQSGSGRQIEYHLTPQRVEFIDGDYKMIAKVDGSTLELDLKTMKKVLGVIPVRHPDFFARQFIGYSLQYFEQYDNPIQIFHAQWQEGSVNHDSFFRKLKVTGDKVLAAGSTWSGVTMQQFGFTEFGESNIAITSNASRVDVFFSKPHLESQTL